MSVFYEAFLELCKMRGVRPGRAADEIGINRGDGHQLEKGGVFAAG